MNATRTLDVPRHARPPNRSARARTTIVIEPRGPFSLAAAAGFSCRFTPASGRASASGGWLRLAFALDGTHVPVGVAVRQRDEIVEVEAPRSIDAQAVTAQVARILSLDHDGSGYPKVADRDPVVGQLLRELDHLRPVCFGSPYEAAGWGVLAQRLPMKQAARIQAALCEHLESSVEVHGERLLAFPRPERILELARFPGLADEKLRRLRGIAEAALSGKLDASRLRALPAEAALAELRTLRGVGVWTASHVLLRGAGVADEPALEEPRIARAYALANGLEHLPTAAELSRAADRWRPYRTWVCVLLASYLARAGRWEGRGPRQS